MKIRVASVGWVVVLAFELACSSGPLQPTAAGSGVSGLTASVTSPRTLSPANNAAIAYAKQPVILTVQNATVTKGNGAMYTFEVATDPGFSNKVQMVDGVAEGSDGQTSLRLAALGAASDYYWHARATAGGTTGVFSAISKFTVGGAISLDAPVPLSPLTGGQGSPRAALLVANAGRRGPAGAITYGFEVAADSNFTTILAAGTTAESTNQTSFTPSSDLSVGATVFWRATAMDAANGVTSAPSAVQSFTVVPYAQAERVAVQLGVVLWPATQPPGSVGHATMGNNWQVQTLYHIPTGTYFQSPTIEMLRLFDVLDRGLDPDGAIGWLNGHGYPTVAQWYPPPEKAVLGVQFVYLAARYKIVVNGTWDLVLKTE